MAIEGGISNINFVSLRDEDDDELVGISTNQDRQIRINKSGSANQDRSKTINPEDDEEKGQLADPTSASTRYVVTLKEGRQSGT